MNKYEVVSGCYVPAGKGFRYRTPGQVVTLSDEQAAELAGNVKPVDPSGGVAKCNTEPEIVDQPVDQLEVADQPADHDRYVLEEVADFAGGVVLDVGDSQAGYE